MRRKWPTSTLGPLDQFCIYRHNKLEHLMVYLFSYTLIVIVTFNFQMFLTLSHQLYRPSNTLGS